MSHHTDDLIIQVSVGMWRQLTERIEALEALLPQAEPEPKSKRGTRLPEAWMPKQETIDQIKSEFPHITDLQLAHEHRSFCDWAYGSSTRNAVKKDWEGTWRNWMRREFKKYHHYESSRSNNDDKIRDLMEMDVHAEGQ